MSNINQLLAELLIEWDDDPVLGIKELFGVEPTKQQIELIEQSWKQGARVAVSSCTGSGKTACLSWLTFMFLLCKEDVRILVTSPSFQQLTRVYYAELLKWKGKMVHPEFKKMFDITRERVTCKMRDEVRVANLVTSSAENPESLAGGHADNYIILGDEASGIPEVAFDYLSGTLSTGDSGRFILTSNPTRSSGRFYEIFHRDLNSWVKLYFEAFDVPHISTKWIEEYEEMYGVDSDQYRIRVLGRFPRAASTQFIRTDAVEEALKNTLDYRTYCNYPIVMGVDVARFGDDETVIAVRQGPKILHIERLMNKDGNEVAGVIADLQHQYQSVTIFIDGIGVGASVVDACKRLKLPYKEVIVSMKSSRPLEYVNIRSQLWGLMRHWVSNGADIPRDKDDKLKQQLVGMTYGYNTKMQIQLTTKKDLRNQGIESPDIAEAIAFSLADDIYATQAVTRARARRVKKTARYL